MYYSSPQDGGTALHMASQNGHEDVVRLLLQSGAQDLPAKVQEKITHQITVSCVYMYLVLWLC